MPSESVVRCCHALKEKNLTIAFAESATTGRLVYEFTSVPDCGETIMGSIVCYDRSVKESLMGVSKEEIDEFTAESAEVTASLARRLKAMIQADLIVAVTGLASPGGSESPDKPVGTMFIHGFFGEEQWQKRAVFDGCPDDIIAQTTNLVSEIILEKLSNFADLSCIRSKEKQS